MRGDIILEVEATGRRMRLLRPFAILGRAASCDLIVSGWRISPKHTLVVNEGRHFLAIDLNGDGDKTDDDERRQSARLLQAQIWLNQLHEPARARKVLARALEDDPSNVAVKQGLVGNGRAEKEQVQHMVRVILALQDRLALDASDALAVALCHAHSHATRRQIEGAR